MVLMCWSDVKWKKEKRIRLRVAVVEVQHTDAAQALVLVARILWLDLAVATNKSWKKKGHIH